ncbi:hypothetical protein C1H46_041904 [Malus baccata]|uniref:Probable magnesium transporter n=1 Tax=Malus baccata TaxID=106549 RepID=A0A540KED3_MALBA|nr:hypothetical protein C1H46_041904 [Malus baccata]
MVVVGFNSHSLLLQRAKKKKGLKKAGTTGTRAGLGGYTYLYEPLWWAGMIAMIVGEIANFAAYAFAPAILVTPLGALSIIVSAVLAHFVLEEKLHIFGVLGCVLCVVGSTSIVLHAPQETPIHSVKQVWQHATQPGFIIYTCIVLILVAVLIFWYVPRYGHTHMIVYVGICSLMGSLTVMSVKAVGIALKLTFSGTNQFKYFETWFFVLVLVVCCLFQVNYLNKALDTFNTAVISPVYYVMFTTFTILASVILFKDGVSQNGSQIVTELCGFITILSESSAASPSLAPTLPHLPSPLSNVDEIHHDVVLILPNPITYSCALKINVLAHFGKCYSERALATIKLLCRVLKGYVAFAAHGLTVLLLVKMIMKISDRVTEYAAGELMSMCLA